MSAERMQQIKDHFEKEALVFDRMFFKVMPHYEEMMQAVVDSLGFKKHDRLKIIDLGCGTGNLTRKIISAYPRAHVTCIDMAENMIKMAKAKLKARRRVSFWLGDVRDFDYSDGFDAIVSSMVLHHIEGKEKPAFYRRLYRALSQGGCFFTIDIFLSSDSHVQKMHMDKWKAFMKANGLGLPKVNDMIARHEREDRPVVFTDELAMLREAGFSSVDVVAKQYNFAVYGARKK